MRGDWREWWEDVAQKPVGFMIDDLRKLHEGFRLLAEAVEAWEAHRKAVYGEERVSDSESHEREKRMHEALPAALDFLRGVGRD